MIRETVAGKITDAWRWFKRKIPQIAIVLITIYAVYALKNTDKHELIPATLFAAFAAICSLQALTYTYEKFRLDLFDQRQCYYDDLVEYCSFVVSINVRDPDYRQEFQELAHKTIRGTGLHRSRLLFGDDIHTFVQQLHEGYLCFRTISRQPVYQSREEEEAALKKEAEHFAFAAEAPNTMPKLFAKYIYFGNYKSDG
jgi:hypothetical protein